MDRVRGRRLEPPPFLLFSSAAVDDRRFKPDAPGNKTPLRAEGASDDLLGVGLTGLVLEEEEEEEEASVTTFLDGGVLLASTAAAAALMAFGSVTPSDRFHFRQLSKSINACIHPHSMIFFSSHTRSTGLVKKSLHPTDNAASRSEAKDDAVNATMITGDRNADSCSSVIACRGILPVFCFFSIARIRFVASMPSMTGS